MPGFIGAGVGIWTIPTTPPGGGTMFVVGDAGLYGSSDGGLTWSLLFPQGAETTPAGIKYFDAVVVDGVITLYYADVVSVDLRMWRSGDGGATWTETELPGGNPENVALEVIDPLRVLVVAADQTSRVTADGGETWADLALPDRQSNTVRLTDTKLWAINVSASAVLRTAYDLSGLETMTDPGGVMTDVHPTSDTLAMAYTQGNGEFLTEIFKITGTTVTPGTPPFGDLLVDCPWMDAYTPGGSLILALMSDYDAGTINLGQLWRSTNGGTSWNLVLEHVDLQPVHGHVYRLACDPTDTALWWCVGGRKGTADAVVWRSVDSGATWEAVVVAPGEQALSLLRVAHPPYTS